MFTLTYVISGPPSPPFNVTASANEGGISVTWMPLPEEHRLGVIQGYNVTAKTTGHQVNVNVSSLSAEVENLLPGKLYRITVAAFNNAGQGPPSLTIVVRSEEGGKRK